MERLTAPTPGFRPVPRTGVIYVMTEAARHGYTPQSEDWINLGQGAPETGPLPGAPDRLTDFHVTVADLEYSPIDGLPELRDAVAKLYNERYRKGKKSQYTRENVAISSGGRVALTRLVSTLGRTNVGHFLPDYTAYEELLDAFGTFVPIPVLLDQRANYKFGPAELENEILGRGLSAVLLSNPRNPTGALLAGEELASWVGVARNVGCTLIFDEFYSHYLYNISDHAGQSRRSISAVEYVEDVDSDPLVIVDGLTKNWRYPGFRVAWTVGPRSIIESIASAGSFLDGGCPRPMQIAALPLVNREIADKEADAIQRSFGEKRNMMLSGLTDLGIKVAPPPQGAFYCWGNLEGLPDSLSGGMRFFRRALEAGVITVPGEFFDINPGQRRPDRPSRFRNFTRFSFGPSKKEIEKGLEKLAGVIKGKKP